jgi:TrmH family RNA methyltransferase
MGGVFHTGVAQVQSMAELERFIGAEKKRCGIKIAGTDSKGALPLKNETLQRPVLLVLGNEAKGMSVALKNLCGVVVSIPLSGNVNSLNVASAAGIFMWEIYRNSPGL